MPYKVDDGAMEKYKNLAKYKKKLYIGFVSVSYKGDPCLSPSAVAIYIQYMPCK